jgi:hypothetical protein
METFVSLADVAKNFLDIENLAKNCLQKQWRSFNSCSAAK